MVDGGLIVAWLAARSTARGLPQPVADHGGWRVDSGQPGERRRYVFTDPCEGLRELGQTIDEPLIALKLCRSNDELFGLLPDRWQLTSETDTKVMVRDGVSHSHTANLPPEYRLEVASTGAVTHARILRNDTVAASGYAAEQDGVFIYDRIATDPAHRRLGLARAVMGALGEARRSPQSREILTATPAGQLLYLTLGWREYSPYSTAMISPA
jgi:GNAT superfamily N-acetyltransferase